MRWCLLIIICICTVSLNKSSEDVYALKAKMRTTSGKLVSAFFSKDETLITKGQSTQGEEITITGSKRYNEYFVGLIIIRPKVGTIDLSPSPTWLGSNCSVAIPFPTNSYSSWGKGSGSITIETLTDSTIKGTFNAVCIGINDTLKVFDGSFNGEIHY